MRVPYRRLKRAADVMLAASGLLAASPVLLVAGAAVKLESHGPVLFAQSRLGLDAHTFTIYKFRSMTVNHGTVGQTYDSSPDVTRVGRVLRRTKVDELPQLWNVIVGDMSLVGPRPPLPSTLDEMPQWAQRRFAVRPGLTGLAQVNGNVSLSWPERWRFDVEYVDRLSLREDMRILSHTVGVVFFGERDSGAGAI